MMSWFPVVAASVLVLAACGPDKTGISPDGRAPGVFRATTIDAPPPYDRSAFGTGWVTVRGHCNTKEIVLERDAGPSAVDTDGDGCRDDAPVLDIYTDRVVDPAHIDIDHVYSLKVAWDSGAWRWTPTERRAFANDPANLRAVGASINRSKGDLTPAQWKPPAQTGWCWFSTAYRNVADKYRLWLSPADCSALSDMQAMCRNGP